MTKLSPRPSESGQTGKSGCTCKLRIIEKRREAGRRRYAANQEAIDVKLLSQENDDLSEALLSHEMEYQNGPLHDIVEK